MPPLTIFFWNTGRRDCLPQVVRLAESHSPDIIVLAESRFTEAQLAVELSNGSNTYGLTVNRSRRLQFFVRFSPTRFQPVHDGPGIAIRQVHPVLGQSILLVGLHLPSKLHLNDTEQALLVTRLASTIRRVENRVGHTRTVVIGDLNMNPFEIGMVGSEGMHAVATRDIANRGSRRVQGEDRRFFYNPMWSLLGDDSAGPPGTYFFAESGPLAYFWHSFDQVLLRPALTTGFQIGDVAVLTTAGDRPLVSPRGRPDPDLSDHLPVLVTVRPSESSNDAQSVG